MGEKLSIEQYLERLGRMVDDEYGQMIRRQFKDIKGSSELAMLETPTGDELEQLKRAVAIMTVREKADIKALTDDEIQKIADDAKIDVANLSIFINGYVLYIQKV